MANHLLSWGGGGGGMDHIHFVKLSKFIGDLLDPLGQIESREEIVTKLGILEYEQLRFTFQNFMRRL